jgi:hypothetical protein
MPTINHSAKFAKALTAALTGHAALTDLVSTRIYCSLAAQGSALPRIVWHDITSTSDHSHDSATTSDPGCEESVVQFDIECRTPSDCRAVADALASLLNGASLTHPDALIPGVFKDSNGFSQSLEHDTDGTGEGHRLSVDYRFFWRDA